MEEILLLGPGPSNTSQRVLNALAESTVGHLDPLFLDLADDLQKKLARLMKADGGMTMFVSGTGSAGMEAAVLNTVEPGDRVFVCVNGVFGGRMAEVSRRAGAEVETVEFPWGEPIDPQKVKEALAGKSFKLVGAVHAETSTGAVSPVHEIAPLAREAGALFLVDCVTSLGGMPFERDEWGIDVAYSGTQKCLSCPPGLAPLTFSERALEVIRNRETPCRSWYLDLALLLQYYTGQKRVYHHTAPINMIYGLNAAVDAIFDEGLEKVHARHRAAHEALVERLGALGLEMFVTEGSRLPMLNAVTVPEGVDEAEVRMRLRKEFKIEIGAGLGPMAGKIWRIGLMGTNARAEVVDQLANAMETCLAVKS